MLPDVFVVVVVKPVDDAFTVTVVANPAKQSNKSVSVEKRDFIKICF
jgi:hypothetical protein